MDNWISWTWLLDAAMAVMVVWLWIDRYRTGRRLDRPDKTDDGAEERVRQLQEHHQQDIDAHRQTEQKLRELLQLMDTLINTIPSPVYFKGVDGILQGCNEAFGQTVLGMSREHIIGQEATVFSDRIGGIDQNAVPDGENGTFEFEVVCADGKKREYLLYAAPVKDRQGKLTGSVGVMMDVTERNRATLERLEREKFQGVLETAGAVCHELNQPLQILSGYAEMVDLEAPGGGVSRDLATQIQTQVQRMAETTRKLQTLTRYETMTYGDRLKIIDIDKSSA